MEFHASGAMTFPILGTAAKPEDKLAYDPDRGKRRAMIVPWGKTKKAKVKVADLSAFGMWSDRPETADPAAYVESIRKPRFR